MLDELFARSMLKVDCPSMALSAEIVIEIRFYIVSPLDNIVGLGAWVKLLMSRGRPLGEVVWRGDCRGRVEKRYIAGRRGAQWWRFLVCLPA
jgi:hypothetical protein